ncbi:uncharacterized protein LOC119608196 [Lucilia sericata]|uniref:uncharacterized protein LOC119608196 n=1 Tax=Lucilia sericata TaxID=13632 RepID=UPI0018A854D7|nr:uncharacterized protein LOC119608196 [Lucilia sericata]
MPRFYRRSQSPLEDNNNTRIRRRFGHAQSSPDCRLCRRDHPLRKCLRFKRMNVSEKVRVVKQHKYCENCLAHSHLVNRCRNTDRCRQCGGRHHTLLHRHKRLRENKRSSQPSTIQSCSNPSAVTLLPTAVVKIQLGEEWRSVRGLLNPCAETSSLAEFIVDRYKIPVETIGSDRWCKIKIRPRFDDAPIFGLTVKVVGDLPTRQPKDKIDDRVALLYTNLRLADPNFYKNIDINVVLGADVYARLIKPNIQPESVGSPLAQDTVLGWIIIGKFGI